MAGFSGNAQGVFPLIAVFAGTQEGRELIERFKELHVPVYASTATDYGSELILPYSDLHVRAGAMNANQMQDWLKAAKVKFVVDATHPYAEEVSANIRIACKALALPMARFERPELEVRGMEKFPDYKACIATLQKTTGRILLTTGSNHLHDFAEKLDVTRLVVRVLPKSEVLKKCEALGLKANQVIAMQGPFSKAMNRSILEDYQIKTLVTKETGRVGGLMEKTEAAREMNIKVYCIQREETLSENVWRSQICLVKWIKEEMMKGRRK